MVIDFMDWTTLVGLVGGTLTTISFLPQLVKIWKTHETKDLSLAMFSTFTVGVTFWLIYGILIGSLPVILTNSITIVLASMILGFKIKYG